MLKAAAAADARVRKGDETAAPEALGLYLQGLALLEDAIGSDQFNQQVKKAMRKRVDSAAGRVTALREIVGDQPLPEPTPPPAALPVPSPSASPSMSTRSWTGCWWACRASSHRRRA